MALMGKQSEFSVEPSASYVPWVSVPHCLKGMVTKKRQSLYLWQLSYMILKKESLGFLWESLNSYILKRQIPYKDH